MHRQKSGAHTHERSECISAPDEGAVTLALAESEAETDGLLLVANAVIEGVVDAADRLVRLPQRVAGGGRRPVGQRDDVIDDVRLARAIRIGRGAAQPDTDGDIASHLRGARAERVLTALDGEITADIGGYLRALDARAGELCIPARFQRDAASRRGTFQASGCQSAKNDLPENRSSRSSNSISSRQLSEISSM